MTDPIEKPSDWARRVCRSLPQCDLNSIMARNAIVAAVTARDAAIGAFAIERRDRDWLLAMAEALGTGSGYKVPIVPETAPFRELFAAVRRKALREAADLLQRNAVEAYGYSNAGRDRALCSGLAKAIHALADSGAP